jgi:hypothetical protein
MAKYEVMHFFTGKELAIKSKKIVSLKIAKLKHLKYLSN